MHKRQLTSSLFVLMATVFFANSALRAAAPKLPSWDQVRKTVDQQLNSANDYQPGDLINRNQVGPVFDLLQRDGWTVPDRVQIMSAICPGNDPMVRQFRSGGGKRFMRQINQSPVGYDRVDQINHLSGGQTLGQSTIDMLITTPGGYKSILNIDKSSNSQIATWMLAPGWQALDFNASTGRIYTDKQLLTRLRQSYDAALAGK